jgi:hypothetical protein
VTRRDILLLAAANPAYDCERITALLLRGRAPTRSPAFRGRPAPRWRSQRALKASQADKLAVECLGRQLALCEGDRVLLTLGDQAGEARDLLETIRRQRFDRLVRIGPHEMGMSLLLRMH